MSKSEGEDILELFWKAVSKIECLDSGVSIDDQPHLTYHTSKSIVWDYILFVPPDILCCKVSFVVNLEQIKQTYLAA